MKCGEIIVQMGDYEISQERKTSMQLDG